MKLNYHIITLVIALGLSACSDKQQGLSTSSETEGANGLASLLLSDAPTPALSISELRKTAEVGDQVVFSGKILGNDTVLIDGRAIMVMGDPTKIDSCDLVHGDRCPTPWDVCCDDQDVIKDSIVTVQVVDTDGKPLKQGFRNVGGIKELSNLVVGGEIAEGSNKENMLINATSLFVVQKVPTK